MNKVYLAGPITGLSYETARFGWRQEISELVTKDADLNGRIELFSPMRAKQFLQGRKVLEGLPDAYNETFLATSSGVTTRDRYDVKSCDMMVANYLGAERISYGTGIEFGWADAWRKPVCMIIEKDGRLPNGERNPHWHLMGNHIAGWIVHSLEEAVFVMKATFTPGV